MRKRIIYTVLVGNNYDNILQLSSLSDEFDYICFVKKGFRQSNYIGIWRIEEIDYELSDNGRLSRYPKIIPHKTCLANYDYSLYIDANINIKDSFIYERFNELVEQNANIALLQHPFRNCVYQEAYVCIASCKGGWFDILRQIFFLKRKGIKKHSGLFEANVIFRKHNDVNIMALGELWWDIFLKYSKRDQLSLIYALTANNTELSYFLEPGFTTRNHYGFDKVSHFKQQNTKLVLLKRKVVKIFFKVSRTLLKE